MTKVVFKLHVTYRLYSVVIWQFGIFEIGLVMAFVLLITAEKEGREKEQLQNKRRQ